MSVAKSATAPSTAGYSGKPLWQKLSELASRFGLVDAKRA
jgi:hypothetical protein